MRWILTVAAVLAVSGTALAVEQKVADSNGKTIGVLVDCSSCQDEAGGKNCDGNGKRDRLRLPRANSSGRPSGSGFTRCGGRLRWRIR